MMLELTGKDILALTNEASARPCCLAGRTGASGTRRPRSVLACTGSTCRMARSLRPAGMRATTSFGRQHGHGQCQPSAFQLSATKGGKLKAGSKAESLLTDKLKELRKGVG